MAARKGKQPPKEGGAHRAWPLGARWRPPPLREASPGEALEGRQLEVAWDGHRVVLVKVGDEVRLYAEDLREWTQPAANVALAVRALAPATLVLRGTLCVLDEHGRPDFALLKRRVATGQGPPPTCLVFDLLRVGDEELGGLPLAERLARLSALGPFRAPLVRSEALQGPLAAVLEGLRGQGLAGVWAHGPSDVVAVPCGAALPLRRSLSAAPALTNPDKVLYPRDGITKREVLAWYQAIAPVLLPHLHDRPVVGQRWPDGIDDFTWFQHRPPPRAPDYLETARIDDDRRILVQNGDALAWLANQAALTLHTWSSRLGSLDQPDWASIDLDPGPATSWAQVIEVAQAVRALLELLEAPSVVKTSGQKGLHVLVPLAPGQSLDQAYRFSRGVCMVVAQLLPEVVSLTHDAVERRGRLFLDHLQNFRGKTLVAPYSLRAVDGAPVSTPLRWDEVTPALDPKQFTRAQVLDRVARHGDLFAPVLSGRLVLAPLFARLPG